MDSYKEFARKISELEAAMDKYMEAHGKLADIVCDMDDMAVIDMLNHATDADKPELEAFMVSELVARAEARGQVIDLRPLN